MLAVLCYLRYQRYLESVLEVADEYQEIQDLLLRHATLQATNDDLRKHQQQSAAEAEETRVALQVMALLVPQCLSQNDCHSPLFSLTAPPVIHL